MERRLDETNLSLESRKEAEEILSKARKAWGEVKDVLNAYEWPDGTTPPLIKLDDPLFERIKEAGSIIWPVIWLLVENKNRKVAENYFMDDLLDLDAAGWEKLKKESI